MSILATPCSQNPIPGGNDIYNFSRVVYCLSKFAGRTTTDNDGQIPIAIGHKSDSIK